MAHDFLTMIRCPLSLASTFLWYAIFALRQRAEQCKQTARKKDILDTCAPLLSYSDY